MKVIVDTSVWSIVLRKKVSRLTSKEKQSVEYFLDLLEEGRIQMIGPVRQELLCGISNELTYEKLKGRLQSFDDLELTMGDYELAAEYFNRCMRKGVAGSHIDFLICAVAHNHQTPVFTLDKDFLRYAKHIELPLYHLL